MKLIFTLLFILLSPDLFSQGWTDYIAKNALPVGENLEPDSNIYQAFKNYRLILTGEMHGTREPAKMVEQLARLILQHEDQVSIGLEIPEEEMSAFILNPSEKTLKNSTFFSKPNQDGRNSRAWFDLVNYCLHEPRVRVFFYDVTTHGVPRDSSMYLQVKKHALAHPSNKILTISGNLHNRLIPYNGMKTLGSYLRADSLLFPEKSICSVYHYYAEGTMLNDTGNGLTLSTIPYNETDFSTGPFPNYFLFYESAEPTPNNCIFFTRKVCHSESINPNK